MSKIIRVRNYPWLKCDSTIIHACDLRFLHLKLEFDADNDGWQTYTLQTHTQSISKVINSTQAHYYHIYTQVDATILYQLYCFPCGYHHLN